jgi:hypothetical protein
MPKNISLNEIINKSNKVDYSDMTTQLTDMKNKLAPHGWKIPETKQVSNTTLDRYYPELSR